MADSIEDLIKALVEENQRVLNAGGETTDEYVYFEYVYFRKGSKNSAHSSITSAARCPR